MYEHPPAKEQCSAVGCNLPATRTIGSVKVCGFHKRATTLKQYGTPVAKSSGRVTERWADWRTYYPPSPVRLVVAVHWCTVCNTGIERRFRYCLDCLHNLSEADQSAELQRLRGETLAKHQRSSWYHHKKGLTRNPQI